MRFGHKEINFIRPAAESAQAAQIACEGPSPSDTLYLKVRNGEYDCAVSMYQNQGQIALKLLGFHMGISVHSGLPFPIATPAHSTAFDIVRQKLPTLSQSGTRSRPCSTWPKIVRSARKPEAIDA